MSSARLMSPMFSSAIRTRTTVSLRTVARMWSRMSCQSRWPCSASMTTQSSPRATAISVMLADSRVTHSPYTGSSAASFFRSFLVALTFISGQEV